MNAQIIGIALVSIKTLTLIFMALYSVFAFVIVRQEHLMADILEDGSEPAIRVLAYGHLIASLVLLAFAFLLLPTQ